MASYLIIDGYNLINKWPRLIKAKRKNIELARSKLFDLIQQYCDHTGTEGIIVYDGNQNRRSVSRSKPMVIFSNRQESADTVIESLMYKLSNDNKVRLITDDRVMGNLACGISVFITSTKMFEIELESVLSSMRNFIDNL